MKLLLIRHGQTTGDVEDRYGGDYDDALSAEGERQVKVLAGELAGKEFEVIYSSPLLRARQTAQVLAAQAECELVVIPGLRERNQYGALTGMVKSEAKIKHPTEVLLLKDKLNTLAGAESYEEARVRMSAAFDDVAAAGHGQAAVVWHGGGMRVLLREILKKGELTEIGDCSWVEVERKNLGWEIRDHARLAFAF